MGVPPRRARPFLLAAVLLGGCKPPSAARSSAPPHIPLPPPAEDEEDTDHHWNVGAPKLPTQTVSIDVTRGTWLDLDVSPDGRFVAFSLLGDLYEIPIDGGEARPLTRGMAWDMQPRYSPDGTRIAFTSDRGGGDNIWIYERDGGRLVPLTKEKFRLLNSPAWSPDGRYIVARKHFTGTRSLGAGELWLYHVAGGSGVRLTERENDQKDLGEPAFSPDGTRIYFSYDATPGKVFEYNKDPHAGIYAIDELDLKGDRRRTVVTGPGGAVRPTPSHDGTRLAYVRRDGLETVLVVMDLPSRRRRTVYRGLSRDMQETWAIHGVYPQMAWTPDDSALVFWAEGRIFRLDLSTSAVRPIPFHVRDTRTIVPAQRVPVEVAPDSVQVRLLQDLEVAPDGDRLLFQALGHVYVMDLPDGRPHRLTSDDDRFEFDPTFSADGKLIAYTTWNDETLGDVRIVPARGGRAKVVSRRPGHYTDPVFVPDGSALIVRRVPPGPLRDPAYGHDTGLWLLPLSDAREPERRLRDDGTDVHFADDPGRFYFSVEAKGGTDRRFELRSMDLSGADERTHAHGRFVTAYRVAPDGRFLAFREGFAAYLAPFAPAADPIEAAAGAEGLPVVRLTNEAGAGLHFSPDGKKLFFHHGPDLYTVSVEDRVLVREGGKETQATDSPVVPPAQRRTVDLVVPARKVRGTLVLSGGRVVTMRQGEVIEDGMVVIRDGRIAAVGPRSKVAVPPGATVLDAAGTTVLPGIVDVHAHGPHGTHGIVPQKNWLHHAELAFGVTTIHDPSNDSETIFSVAEMARAGLVTAPRIFSTGTILYGAETPFMARIEDLTDARYHVRRMKALGAHSIKSYNQPRRDQRQMLLAAAREYGVNVVPEGGSLFQHDMTMVVDGHTGIEHALPVPDVYEDVVQLFAATDVGYTPTLVVGYGGLFGELYWYAESDVFAHERLRRFVPPEVVEPRARRRLLASKGDWNHVRIARACKKLQDAGVSIQVGAHGQREGLAAHWEIWSLVDGGMRPIDALRAATLDGARYLGYDGALGSIEPGKLADLFVVEGNPLVRIRESEKVRWTVLGGEVYDAKTMARIFPEPAPAPVFYFQRNEGSNARPRPADAHGHGVIRAHEGVP